MTDRIDIVPRLRILWTSCSDQINAERNFAADEIERLRQLLGNTEQLRKERDEARREICNIVAGKQGKQDNQSPDAIEHAKLREWDCFNTPVSEVRHVLNGVVSEVRKAAPPAFEVEE